MLTEKIYESKCYAKDFYATVLACIETEKGYALILDKTAFFPEGGGQACDLGMIDGVPVEDVQIIGGEIYHYVCEKFEVGKEVQGIIDWPRRFRNMQNHSGEHIISGIINKHFNLNNIGFHLGEDDVTMDYDGELTEENIKFVEDLANKAVSENISINSWYPTWDELRKMEYRSKLELTENIRIVRIAGYDICACCAPHVRFTGEIGLMKITEKYRQNKHIRLKMVCGRDALVHYKAVYSNISEISKLVSSQYTDAFERVETLMNNYTQCKRALVHTSSKLAITMADAIEPTKDNITIFLTNTDTETLRKIVNSTVLKTPKIAMALSGNDIDGYNFIAASENINMLEFSKTLKEKFISKCGGSATMIQGQIITTKEELQRFLP